MTSSIPSVGSQDAARARHAYRSALALLIASVISLLFYAYWAAQYRTWQMWVATSSVALYAGSLVWVVRLTRRGRSTLGIGLLIGGMLSTVQVSAALLAGIGLPLGIAIALAAVAIATQTLRRPNLGWACGAAIVAGGLSGLLDLSGPFDKIAVAEIGILAPLIIVSVLVVHGIRVARQYRSLSLRFKLSIGFLLVSLIPLAVLTLVNLFNTRDALTESANRSLASAAQQTAESLDTYFSTTLNNIQQGDANAPALVEYVGLPADQRPGSAKELDALRVLRVVARRSTPYVVSYALLDLQGTVLLDTDSTNIGRSEFERDYFQEPLRTRVGFVSPVTYMPAESRRALIFFGVPVKNVEGEIIGLMRVSYDYAVLQDMVRVQNGLAGSQSFGALFDEYHVYLAHGTLSETRLKTAMPLDPDLTAYLQSAHRLPNLPESDLFYNLPRLDQGLATEQRFFIAEDVASGQPTIQAAAASLRTRPWRIVFFQPREEFFKVVDLQTRNTILLGLLTTGVVAGAALAMAATLTRPIRRLTAVAEKVGVGDLSAQATVSTDDEIGRLASAFNLMAAQMRVFIDSLELQVEARTAQLEAAADVGRAVASILDPEALLHEVVNLITDRFGFYYAAVFTLDETGRMAVLRAATGEAGDKLVKQGHRLEVGSNSMVGYATAQRKSRVALDVGEEAIRFANPLLPQTRSEIALPLIAGGRVLGALDVQSTLAAAFDDSNTAVLQAMADQIAIALSNAAVHRDSQKIVNALNGLLEMSRDIAGSRTLDDLRDRTLKYVKDIIGSDNYYIALTDEAQSVVRFVVQSRPEMEVRETIVRPFGGGRTEYVIRTRQVVRIDQMDASERLASLGVKTWEKAPGAFLGVPMTIGGRVLGMIGLQSFAEGAAFTELQERLTIALANQIGATLDNLRLAEETQRALAELDAANRRLTREGWAGFATATGKLEGAWVGGHWEREAGAILIDEEAQRSMKRLSLPIQVRGQTVGQFDLDRVGDGSDWTEDDREFAWALINEVGQTIETARLLEETERLAVRDRLINEINSRVRRTVDMDSILKTTVDELGRSLGAVRVFVRIGEAREGSSQDLVSAERGRGDGHA